MEFRRHSRRHFAGSAGGSARLRARRAHHRGWGRATKQTNNLARALIARGAAPGDKIAIYMRNRPEYLMALAAGFKARMTHVNVNYRYTPQEVWYIFDNSDAQAVVYRLGVSVTPSPRSARACRR